MDIYTAMTKQKQATKNKARYRVFDWNKAARLIRGKWFKKGLIVVAGLSGDDATYGTIYKDGKPTTKEDFWGYLLSNWATPIISINSGKEIECWIYADEAPKEDDWQDNDAFWPKSAIKILNGE